MPFLQRLRIILQSKLFIVISLVLIIIYVLIFTKAITYESLISDKTTELSGQIISFMIDGNKLSLLIKDKEKVQVTYYINSLEEKEYLEDNLLIGAKVNLVGTVTEAYNNTIPNTFNYKEYLYNNHIYITFRASKISLTKETDFLNNIKSKFMKKIDEFASSKAYLYALILGEIDYIDNDTYKEYQESGTTHLFAVSGMHISAIAMMLNAILKKVHLKEGVVDVIVVTFLFFYMFLVGFTPSVVRGGLLYIFLLLNRKIKLRLPTLNVLYLLFLLLVLIDPFYIYNLGFIYSFITSFGLILFSKKISGNYFLKLIKISAIAFLFSLPITIYNFYEVNLMTIVNNTIIVPLVTVILFPLTLLTFIMPVLDNILSIGISGLEFITKSLNLLAVNLVVPKINVIFILVYYLSVYLIYKYHVKYVGIIVILVGMWKLCPFLNSNSYIYFLDIGQGDATVIVGKGMSYVVMIDIGGKITYQSEEWEEKNKTYDNASNVITFLKSLGITKIDVFIATHGDFDHMGEVINLVDNFNVLKVIYNNDSFNDLYLEVMEALNDKKIIYQKNITQLKVGNNKLYFLNDLLYDNENDNSNVIYTQIEGFNLLLMGDAGSEVEKDILKKYSLENIDILKVGHHGSKSSSSKAFIQSIRPKYAIISVGRNNRYGHPNQEVLDNLAASIIYRTDQDGSIEWKLKKGKLEIKTYPPFRN